MFYTFLLSLVNLLIYLLIFPSTSSRNYQTKHSSLQVISNPDISPEAKRLLKKYGSLHTMREYIYWAITEENIYLYLHKIIRCLEFERKQIKRKLQQLSTGSPPLQQNIYTRSNAFLRYYRISALGECKNIKATRSSVFKVKKTDFQELWIGLSELYLSLTGLLTIQKLSLLSPEKLQSLKLGVTNHVNLTPQHIMIIGLCSLFRKMYSFAVAWLEVAQNPGKSFHKPVNLSIDYIDFVGFIRYISIQEHNRASNKPECTNEYLCYMNLFTEPLTSSYLSSNNTLTRRRQLLNKNSKPGVHGIPEDQSIKLCSNSVPNINPSWKQSQLKCHYEQFRHPYLYINPVKTEKLSDSPSIYQYYEIVGPELINELIAHYEENATLLAMVLNMNRYSGPLKLEEMSANSVYDDSLWQKYVGNPIFYRLAEAVTGIKFNGSTERFSFIDYIPGRTVEAHDDIYRENPEFNEYNLDGNRYADILYYLELSEKGGETAFCQAGLKGYLTKGSMLVWINKYKNGSNRIDLHHAACPVIQGNKIVLSQAVLYTEQWNHVKCSLNKFE